jgi:hypothetical protein
MINFTLLVDELEGCGIYRTCLGWDILDIHLGFCGSAVQTDQEKGTIVMAVKVKVYRL